MTIEDQWIVIGKLGRPHGVKGFIKVQSFSDPKDGIFNYTNWHVRNKSHWMPINVLSKNIYPNLIIINIDGYETREKVADLTNFEIGVLRSQLPALQVNDYYWHQLVGLNAFNLDGEALGKVVEIMPTGTNDVLVIQGNKRYLIPYFLGESIVKVDLEEQKIIINWSCE